ncbi:MAG: DUF4831 family protein [Duncaniella sp.]|nr:DUF4831 family protein [Duncaniella sp.]
MRLPIALVICATLGGFTASAQSTSRLSASKANEYGVTYALPLTRFQVTLAAEKTVKTPGEFARYAGKYLNADPILHPSVGWRLTRAVITPDAYADPDERYLVTFRNGDGTYITLTEWGTPLAINDENYSADTPDVDLPVAVPAAPTILELPVARQAVTADMIQSKSLAKKAELAAAKIYELRANRNEIITGQADGMPADGAAMQLALDQINAQEEALTAMFLGTVKTSVEVRTFTVEVPAEGAPERSVVARLSALDGIVDADDLSGAPIYVSVVEKTRGELPLTDKGQPRPFPRGGVAYRIPGSAHIAVSYDGATLAEDTFEVAQYGVVYGLDPAMFTAKKAAWGTKNAPSYLHFDPLTGAVSRIGVVGE